MSLEINRQNFLSGKLPKADFIRQNYEECHARLFELADYLKLTDICAIEIRDGLVIMTYRRSGMKLCCEPNEYRTAPIETLNFLQYEEDEASVFNKLLKGKKKFFDIGGNIGFYAVNAAMLNPELEVETFEPVPKMFFTLARNVDLNNPTKRVRANNFGFSDADGEVKFYVYPFGGTNASMVNVSEAKDAVEYRSRVRKLDDYVAEGNGVPDIIKCDVEGAEKLVLMGALNTIRTHRPVLFFELLRKWSAKFNYHPNEVLKTLKDLGYNCYAPYKGALKPFGEMDESTTETNFFFLHQETHKAHIKELVV